MTSISKDKPRGERLTDKLNMVFTLLAAQRDDVAEKVLGQVFDELAQLDAPEKLQNGATVLHRKITRDPNVDIIMCEIQHGENQVEWVTWIQNKDDVARGHDGTYYGHYMHDRDLALDDFLNRQ